MPEQFRISFDQTDGSQFSHTLQVGNVLFILGANGTGKSSLISKLYNAHHANAKRISAHRQTWFTSNTLNMTPESRDRLAKNINSQDQQSSARYMEEYAAERPGLAMYDLIDSDTMLAREIAALVRADKLRKARTKAKIPSMRFGPSMLSDISRSSSTGSIAASTCPTSSRDWSTWRSERRQCRKSYSSYA